MRGRYPRAVAEVRAEITANVWQVHVEVGQAVGVGDTIAILESMKMEIPVESPAGGTVAEVRVRPDEQVVGLGPDLAADQRPQFVVPAGAWQSARSLGEHTLVGCTVSPAFELDGFEVAEPGWCPGRRSTG